MNLIMVKVVRNVLSVIMSTRSRQGQYCRAAIFLTPEAVYRVDLTILKFGNPVAGFQVGRNLRRNRSDVSGHWKSPPKSSQIKIK